MTDKHLFVVAAVVSLCTIVSLIWGPDGKSWLWRKTMFVAFAGYAVAAMLAWLNQYTVPDLMPFAWFAYVTLGMMVLIALNYYLNLHAPVEVPDLVVEKLSSAPDATTLIADYRGHMLAEQQRKQRTGVWVALAGIGLIGIAFTIIHSFGLAENMNGKQEDFSKVLIRLVAEVRLLSGEVRNLEKKQDSTRKDVRVNGGRITKIEKRNVLSDRRDSINTIRLLNNQKRMLRKPPIRSLPIQPIPPTKPWWKIGYQQPLPQKDWQEQPVEYQHPE